MKKIAGILICLFAALVSYSQGTDFQPEWTFGVNAGATLSRMNFHPRIPQDLLIQETGGLTVKYISEKNFGIQLELNYSLRGWKEETDTVVHFNKYSRSLAYLELPLMTHLYFSLGKRARLVFNAGPQIGWNIGEKVLEKQINASEYPAYYDREVQRKFDYGITGGLGLEARTGVGNFILEGRYYFGLYDIFNHQRSDDFQSSSNQVIGIKLTYLFQIIKH
jgi:hypothetical protein